MRFAITQKPAFLSDFLTLSREIQRRVVAAVAELEIDPVRTGGNIKKLRYYKNLWRYRIDDYRIVYTVGGGFVQLLGIGRRDEVYKRLHYEPDVPDVHFTSAIEALLQPEREAPKPEWTEYLQPPPRQIAELPQALTSDILDGWRIPAEFQHALVMCRTDEDLLNAGIPDEYLQRVMDCLWPPTVTQIAQQPTLVLQEPADLERYASGDLIGFLLKLDDDQKSLTEWSLGGPTMIKGGPGSGKSTVALYRVRALIDRGRSQNRIPRILFTTYTNALIRSSTELLRSLLGDLPRELAISTIDSIASRIVGKVEGNYPPVADTGKQREALRTARRQFQLDAGTAQEKIQMMHRLQELHDDYLLDEFDWIIEGRNLKTVQDYMPDKTNRTGRGIRFDANMRKAVWGLHQAFKKVLQEEHGLITWGELRSRALEYVRPGRWTQRWDSILIDEAQDLRPTALALCVELAADPSGLFLTADSNQSLYNRGFRWKDVHDAFRLVGRTRMLGKNYRNTRQIAEAALDIVLDTDLEDLDALAQECVHVGPKPALRSAHGLEAQTQEIVAYVIEAARDLRLGLGSAAILCASNPLAQQVAEIANRLGLRARYMEGRNLELEGPDVKVITIHSAKGLEFPIVALPCVNAGVLPRHVDATAEDKDERINEDRRLLFVGVTRAMRRLIVTCDAACPSAFLYTLSDTWWDRSRFHPLQNVKT